MEYYEGMKSIKNRFSERLHPPIAQDGAQNAVI
jgi:hypothetical protein